MDHFLARDEPRSLFAASSEEAFTPATRPVFERAVRQVEAAFARLYAGPEPRRVIHNDLWHGNIKVDRGRLRPLDFEDTLWGYPVQDIAMAMLDLLQDAGAPAYPALLAAFRRGYERALPWPEQYPGQMDDFQTGRKFWVANFVAHKQRPYLREHLDRLAPRLERYLKTGFIVDRAG
jgi:Ser/Thr protein kinase RdoA (MazF antagonist)